MNALVKFACMLLVATFVVGREPRGEAPKYWEQIRSLNQREGGHTELLQYLKSLTPEEMLTAARQSCSESSQYSDEPQQAYLAGLNVRLCLEYYFENCDEVDECARTLLGIVSDTEASPWFRHAIISKMSCSRDSHFIGTFQAYVEAHRAEVNPILASIVSDRRENALLREEAMYTLAEWLRGRAITTCAKDPNVRAVKERTHKIVPVGEMVRSGELTLTEDTWKALRPIEKRILENSRVLSAILADEENEPEVVRARAKSMLKAYQRLPLTEEGQAEIRKGLQEDDQ